MKITKFILGLALVIAFFSCNKDDNDDNEIIIISEEIKANPKFDIINEDVLDIVEDELLTTLEDREFGRLPNSTTQFLRSCATVTRVPDFDTNPTEGQLITKTIDFGTTYYCNIRGGNYVKGKIIITFNFNPSATTQTVNFQLVDFYHNDNKFNGTNTLTRTMSAAVDGHPILKLNMDLNVTFNNGIVYKRVGTRVREFIEGISTLTNSSDDVYKITGSWTTTFSNATVQTSTVTTPLFVKKICEDYWNPLIPSLGIITITRNDNVATLDYGNGNCDNLAFIILKGVSHPITFEKY